MERHPAITRQAPVWRDRGAWPARIGALAAGFICLVGLGVFGSLEYRARVRAHEHEMQEANQRKAHADCQSISPGLVALLQAWRQTQPGPDDPARAYYDLALVIDLPRRQVRLERGESTLAYHLVTLPDGYTWQAFQVTPDASQGLPDVVRLQLRGHCQQKNVFPEIIAIQGRLDALAGLYITVEPGNGYRMGMGTGVANWRAERAIRRQEGRITISESLLVTSATGE